MSRIKRFPNPKTILELAAEIVNKGNEPLHRLPEIAWDIGKYQGVISESVDNYSDFEKIVQDWIQNHMEVSYESKR